MTNVAYGPIKYLSFKADPNEIGNSIANNGAFHSSLEEAMMVANSTGDGYFCEVYDLSSGELIFDKLAKSEPQNEPSPPLWKADIGMNHY